MTAQLVLFAEPGRPDRARDAIRTRLDETLFVEAGAGTGKTAALVDAHRRAGDRRAGVPMRSIAAITFTEKAAAELRDRDSAPSSQRPRRRSSALDELDDAAICTLHAFAQRILTEFPIEAGLPPRIEVRDEISSLVAFEARWRTFCSTICSTIPALEQPMLVMLAAGVRPEHLRARRRSARRQLGPARPHR